RRRVLVARRARQPRRGDIHVTRLLFDAPLAETMRRRLERAGLDDVAANGKERLVDRLNDVGASEDQVVVAALETLPAEVVRGRVVELNVRTHRAIEDEDAVSDGLEIGAGSAGVGHRSKKKRPETRALGQAF